MRVFHGDCREVLAQLPDCSVDSIVTDPPYGLGFMGKEWDSFGGKSGISDEIRSKQQEKWGTKFAASAKSAKPAAGEMLAFQLWCNEWAVECLRVLKPGGHLLAFGGTRTWHRLAVAIEDAGFEVRDSIAWMYGSGFPKSLDIAKALNKKAGVQFSAKPASGVGFMNNSDDGYNMTHNQLEQVGESSPEAKTWEGWGTALKPAFEPIVVGRKPLVGTVAENVLRWGVGGLNIDGSRIGTETVTINSFDNGAKPFGGAVGEPFTSRQSQGRWPANVILDEHAAELLDEQSGVSKPKTGRTGKIGGGKGGVYGEYEGSAIGSWPADFGGGASRFFYVAKASKRDRNEGLQELEDSKVGSYNGNVIQAPGNKIGGNPKKENLPGKNFHPTVKPTALMRYLVKLVTPPRGVVLDPFTGSGSTGKAAILEGFQFVGIELTEDYLPIVEGRLRWAIDNREKNETLF